MRMRIVLSRYGLFFCAKVCIITYVHVCACVELESARGVNHVNRKHVVCTLMHILKQTLGTADHVCGRDGF